MNKNYFDNRAVLFVGTSLALVVLIYFSWIMFFSKYYGVEFVMVEPDFGTIFTVVFVSLGSIVALSRYRREFSEKQSKVIRNLFDTLPVAKKFQGLSNYTLLYRAYLGYIRDIDLSDVNIREFIKLIEVEYCKSPEEAHQKVNYFLSDNPIFREKISASNFKIDIKDILDYQQFIISRTNLLNHILKAKSKGLIDKHDKELLIHEILTPDFIETLKFCSDYRFYIFMDNGLRDKFFIKDSIVDINKFFILYLEPQTQKLLKNKGIVLRSIKDDL